MFDKIENEVMKNWKSNADKPLVSICCITYNHEEYLHIALDSFLMQMTDFAFEIVIGEDCSTDNTLEVIKRYQLRYPKIIKIVTSDCNVGIQKNSYRTMHSCSGEYIALCDGDDYWLDDQKLQLQINEMKINSNYGMSFHPTSQHKSNDEIKKSVYKYKNFYSLFEIIESDFHFISTNSIVFKKNILKNLDKTLFLKSPVNDVWVRIIASMEAGALCINREMSAYRVQSSNSWTESMKNSEKFISFIEKMLHSITDFDDFFSKKYNESFLKFKQRFFRTILFKQDLSFELKKDFIERYFYLLRFTDKIMWFLIFSHPNLIKLIKKMKHLVSN